MKFLRWLWQPFRLILSGAVVGVANIIPGVSGGTMAVILGVYDRMIEALGLKKLRKNLGFLVLLVIGLAAGVLAFSGVVEWALGNYPVATTALFFGLVLGSVPMIFGKAGGKNFRFVDALPLIGGIAVMVAFTLLDRSVGSGSAEAATSLNFGLFFLLLICGFISTIAMLLPGISGSAMMMIFGQYYTVIGAIGTFTDVLRGAVSFGDALPRLLLLIPAGIGVLAGLVLGSRAVDKMLHKYPKGTYAAILGLILGSLIYLFPAFSLSLETAVAVVLLVGGTAVSYLFTRTAK